MKLVVGLGNPGKEYENTRHNVGFMVIDHYLDNNIWKSKFDGLYQIVSVQEEKVLFLKPQTFMNNSGISVKKAMNFYNILPEDVFVIHDDMDLNFHTYKLKTNSSSGGHNGIKSIISSLQTESFCRLKIGISHDKSIDTIHYVLGKFSKSELDDLYSQMPLYKDIINFFILNGFAKTMNQYNNRG